MDKLDLILQKLDGVNTRFDGLDQKFDKLSDRVDGLDQKVDELKYIVVAVREKGNVSNINEQLNSLTEGQQRQDKILESLSMRSLEQETDIRELKRIK